jgi:hypothetical protein
VIGLHIGHFQGFVYPFTQPVGDLLPLGIRPLAAPRAGRFVEQRLADASPLLHVLQKALLDEMLVDRHTAQPFALGDFRPEHETPMLHDLLDIGRQQRRDFVYAGAGVGADPGHPAPGRLHLVRDQVRGRRDRS